MKSGSIIKITIYALTCLLTFSVAFAINDSPQKFTEEEPFIEEEFEEIDPSIPYKVLDEEYIEIQGNVEDSFYGKIYYDVYERAYRVEDYFPFGYRATVDYKYFPKNYQRELDDGNKYWIPVVQYETGIFYNDDGEELSRYEIEYNEKSEVISSKKENFSLMFPIMRFLAFFLGADEDDVKKYEEEFNHKFE